MDGDEPVRLLLTSILEDVSGGATAVRNAEEARRELQRFDYALALIDNRLAGESGAELIRWMSVDRPTTSSIMLTADSDPLVATRALEIGARCCILKPFKLDALTAEVETALLWAELLS